MVNARPGHGQHLAPCLRFLPVFPAERFPTSRLRHDDLDTRGRNRIRRDRFENARIGCEIAYRRVGVREFREREDSHFSSILV